MKKAIILLVSLLLLTSKSQGASSTDDAVSLFYDIGDFQFGWSLTLSYLAEKEKQFRVFIKRLNNVSMSVDTPTFTETSSNGLLEQKIEDAYKEKLLVWMNQTTNDSKSHHRDQFVIYFENSYKNATKKLFDEIFPESQFRSTKCNSVLCSNIYESFATLISKGVLVETAYACFRNDSFDFNERGDCRDIFWYWNFKSWSYQSCSHVSWWSWWYECPTTTTTTTTNPNKISYESISIISLFGLACIVIGVIGFIKCGKHWCCKNRIMPL